MSEPTPRTTLSRIPSRGSHDRAVIDAILDEALYCHVGVATGDGPVVVPTAHWRQGDELFVHGFVGSRLVRALAGGSPACVTITLFDGLVLARSAFHHSVNYRSVMVFGVGRPVDEPAEKAAALEAFLDTLAPGRWAHIRAPDPGEMKRTRVIALPLDEASAKVRAGPPVDDEPDMELPVWAGVVPASLTWGAPRPSPDMPADRAAAALGLPRGYRSS